MSYQNNAYIIDVLLEQYIQSLTEKDLKAYHINIWTYVGTMMPMGISPYAPDINKKSRHLYPNTYFIIT